jgi:TonB family protein
MSSRAPESVAGPPAQPAANARQDDASGQASSVIVHVCVDQTGTIANDPTIERSSGVPALDQAAVRIAASGAAYYRPDTSSNGPRVSGCAQLAIKFETK